MNEEEVTQEVAHEATKPEFEQNMEQRESPSPQESWKEARERIKQQDETIKELSQRQQQYEEYLKQMQNSHEPSEPDVDIDSLPDDYLLEAKDYKRASKKQEERYRQLEERQIISDMRDKYDDFRHVCTDDNIRKLKKTDPDFAETVLMNPNPAKQWELVYKAIKREGIYKPEDEKDKDMIADYNTSRPKTISQARSSQSKSAIGQAGAFSGVLTQEQKQEYYKRAKRLAEGQ